MSETSEKYVRKTELVMVKGGSHALECWGHKYWMQHVHKIRGNVSLKYTEHINYCAKYCVIFKTLFRSHMITLVTFGNCVQCKENLDFEK
jgi:hypothetical protein